VIGNDPPFVRSLLAIVAVNCVVLEKLVGRSDPFQRTTELAMKLLPCTVRVKAAPKVETLAGEIDARIGASA